MTVATEASGRECGLVLVREPKAVGLMTWPAVAIAEALPPSLSLPHRKSGIPDLRIKMGNPGKPGLRGAGDDTSTPGV